MVPGIVITENIRLRASYRGTQAARVLLPVAATKKLLKAGKLSIGWVNCRVRLRKAVIRCFKYHETGQEIIRARNYKSVVDRSSMCFRCRKEGYKAVNCLTANKHVT